MPETHPPLGLDGRSLAALAEAIGERRLPPVDQWHPAHCGDSEMVIHRDGRWTYRGEPIARPAMVRLFATVLRREPDGSHVLVTPAERLTIGVEGTPFRAIAMRSEGDGRDRRIALDLDHADPLFVGPDHPLTVVDTPAGPSPRVRVRGGLEAELARPVYYELAEIALAEGADPPGLWSSGAFFALASQAEGGTVMLAERLAAALALAAPDGLSAGDLHEGDAAVPTRDAAVLVAVTDRPEPGLLFIVRPPDMRTHAGQVAFPGGQVDPDDRDPAHTALREAWEELAIDPAQVRVCGLADRYRTITNYCVTPVVGVVPPDLDLRPDPSEVADWFEAPLDFLLDPANQVRHSVQLNGRPRNYTQIDWQDRRIWGATAAMIVNLSRRLRARI